MKLLIFTFSPVQSFIASSRKLLDLFNASYILSHLTESLIEHIVQNNLGEVIYPVYEPRLKEKSLAGYPNRLVVKTDKDLCEELSKVFEERWSDLYMGVKSILGLGGRVGLQFEKHADSYFKTFCHCIDFVNKQEWMQKMALKEACGEADDYGYTYDLLERYLGAKKSFRPYRGLVDEETLEGKYPDGCTQCGEYPALAIDWQGF
ncbi:MAG: hypothetical protein NZ526_07355, partial [Aquificaceae bacterium]|nr:hypothetical protein [Aquificaceae bacterium]